MVAGTTARMEVGLVGLLTENADALTCAPIAVQFLTIALAKR
jgi:hypothetical protein